VKVRNKTTVSVLDYIILKLRLKKLEEKKFSVSNHILNMPCHYRSIQIEIDKKKLKFIQKNLFNFEKLRRF